jgi:adenylosuccinate synthase
MTKADVLSGMDTIKVCTGYKIEGKETSEVPFDHSVPTEPVYKELKGWNQNISSIQTYNELPAALKQYIEFIEKETRVPVTMVSVGPDRKQTIYR